MQRAISRLASPAIASALGVLALALGVAAVPLEELSHQSLLSHLDGLPVVATFGVVGVIVARQRPRHPMGWIFLGIAIGFPLNSDASLYSILDYRTRHGTLPFGPVAVLLQPAWAPAIVLSGLAILLFPDGRLPANRLRWVAWTVIGIGALWMLGAYLLAARAIVEHTVHIEPSGDLTVIDHPTGDAVWWGRLQTLFFPVLFGSWVLWLGWQAHNYRRSSGERRLQLKWLLSGAAIFIVSLPLLLGSSDESSRIWDVVAGVSLLGLAALPISIGAGILKFRLYEIDRLISRTISYVILTATLIGVFAGIVGLTTRVLPFSSPIAVATSTLAAAALFNPLRQRVQHVVDRRFNRARYDADATVAAFTTRLKDAVDLASVRAELLSATDALQPSHASVWIRTEARPP